MPVGRLGAVAPSREHLLAGILLVVAFAGCLGRAGAPQDADPPEAGPEYPRGVHPYPRGDEWPAGLEGPFELSSIERVHVPSHDGVTLDGWLFRPTLPTGLRAPVIVQSSPYFGTGNTPVDPASRSGNSVPIDDLVAAGFAVGAFSVRGTGDSGGCFSNKGVDEQKDQVALVEWAASQEWSNGRVAMMGISYHGTTPLMAAVQNPPALKTVVVMGPVTDPYTELHSPQGAMYTGGGVGDANRRSAVSLLFETDDPPPEIVAERLAVLPGRVCPEYARVLTAAERGHMTDDRDAAFWDERRLLTRFPNVTAAVFIAHGLKERDHPFQEDVAWESLAHAPKRMLLGQWGHQVPPLDDWYDRMFEWLDFWLKGIGATPPGVGRVDYELGTGEWRNSTAWPPAESRLEAINIGANLSPSQGFSAQFRSAPTPNGPHDALCGLDSFASPYIVEAGPEPFVLAGNPMAYLRVTSDQPGGLVAAHVFDLPADFVCEDGKAVGALLLASGAADLRFDHGNLVGEDFPVNSPRWVRIDLTNLAERVEPDRWIALVIGYGQVLDAENPDSEFATDQRTGRSGQPYMPTITLGVGNPPETSHLVLPFLEGSLGGQAPTLAYPPRPFTPQG